MRLSILVVLFVYSLPVFAQAGALAAAMKEYDVVDLSVTVSETMPAHWAMNPPLQRWTNNWFVASKNSYGTQAPSEGPYYSQRYVIDEHTGTQTDFPAHFVPPPTSGLPGAGPQGLMTGDKYPISRMMGPAVVINVGSLLDKAAPGKSPVITLDAVKAWEKQHGEVRPGDVVVFHSGYTDKYYKPLPEGLRLTYEPVVAKTKPGWPAPSPELMEYLFQKGVWHLGTDGPSMGPAEGGQAVHVAGLKHGMSWEEMLIGLGQLPARGAYYLALGIKVIDQSGSPSRAIAFVPRRR
ncbi:MAG: cyclase family protein [Acidobacteria bacterium]|nr:cyclase family protein [Acidobacteriota bacterium]